MDIFLIGGVIKVSRVTHVARETSLKGDEDRCVTESVVAGAGRRNDGLDFELAINNNRHLSDSTSTSETDRLDWGTQGCKSLLNTKRANVS